MKRGSAFAAGAVLACVAACSSNDAAMQAAEEAHRFGWIHPIAPYNTPLPVTTPIGAAPQPVAGHSISAIVVDPDVRVRSDGNPCVTCHDWAKTIDRATFCNEREPAFQQTPTATGDGNDPPNAKPWILKELFAEWKAAGCPE